MTRTEPIVIPAAVVDALILIISQLSDRRSGLNETTSVSGVTVSGPSLLDGEQAGDLLGVHASTVRKLWNSGELKCVRIGRGRQVSTIEIERFIRDRERFEPS
ncbi:helix-turn-helix domain-containing protein [Rhodococcus sp. IEGM 1318]|uniref:helix-turn-helix domain-containing protein n=1 Tax=Rhodococcus sp. IEGM 1318 TaxID=3082226 RepID=UPI002954ACE4|nr:helix-turn-helix domain-containing protein [Rhodococcus sp. IEGM 1318]MDV8006316.1 helix-turn-helix domain-containing protein [Rhodococcus sp. IEGM 1318]